MWLLSGPVANVSIAEAKNVLHVPSADYPTIQAAIDASNPGNIIQLAKGTYNENVLIEMKHDIQLRGRNSLLQGSGNLDTAGIGIHISNSYDIRVQGFIVEGYELGVLLEGTHDSHVHNVETRNNDSNVPMRRDGLAMWSSDDNQITNVYAHHNGHNGITLRNISTGNTMQGNTASDNGLNSAVAMNVGGCGIQLVGGGHDHNIIAENETERNGWGIQIGPGSNDNRVVQNRSHENQRAGVVVLDSGSNNFIGQNNARGNGLANIMPSFAFDLFDAGILNNTWRNNKGTSNF